MNSAIDGFNVRDWVFSWKCSASWSLFCFS